MWKYIAIALGLLYVLSPFDFLPDWFIGWGWLDDLVIIGFVARFFLQRLDKVNPSSGGTDPGVGTADEKKTGNTRSKENLDDTETSAPKWDPYRVLELNRSASGIEIKQAYRRLANQYHPDKVDHLGKEFRDLAEIKFKEIQRAYKELK